MDNRWGKNKNSDSIYFIGFQSLCGHWLKTLTEIKRCLVLGRKAMTNLDSILNVHQNDWCWGSNTLATSCEEATFGKKAWLWERLKTGAEGDNRRWDGWVASPLQWTWVWANSGRWWRAGSWHATVHGVAKNWTQLNDWTTLTKTRSF